MTLQMLDLMSSKNFPMKAPEKVVTSSTFPIQRNFNWMRQIKILSKVLKKSQNKIDYLISLQLTFTNKFSLGKKLKNTRNIPKAFVGRAPDCSRSEMSRNSINPTRKNQKIKNPNLDKIFLKASPSSKNNPLSTKNKSPWRSLNISKASTT